MKKYIFGMIIGLLCVPLHAYEKRNEAKAKLYNQAGKIIGKVEFSQHKHNVKVKVNVTGLPAGFHGFHVHTTGQCTIVNATPPFTSAGGHFKLDPTSNHKDHNGDLPVLLVNKNGAAKTEFRTDRFKVKDLFDADGSAVIIHAAPDNYANIPAGYTPASADVTNATLATGDAGGRSVCGVVKY
ncbi:Superoxide dismutase (Cu-Zn) [Crenothrix polyspora]|uniref:Superoxide dismutase [Cu-Zn] n=1 Tax=Crenothrix polyspora TaxID=360316 RepID=A0A1R4H0S5_9GAMM|nr:superoxide dismutase family protein [Crenothrix polyspora]SJM89815.1 Superoxide dismutase (Cu-Zn) [Crenothrix polyspora]